MSFGGSEATEESRSFAGLRMTDAGLRMTDMTRAQAGHLCHQESSLLAGRQRTWGAFLAAGVGIPSGSFPNWNLGADSEVKTNTS